MTTIMSLEHFCSKCESTVFEEVHIGCITTVDNQGFKREIMLLRPESFSNGEYDELRKKILPKEGNIFGDMLVPSDTKKYDLMARDVWIKHFKSWCIPPSSHLVREIVDFVGTSTILELGGGSGLYASILKQAGLRIICTDSYLEKKEDDISYTNVERLTASEAMKKYGDHCNVLLIIWSRGFPSSEDLKFFKGYKAIVIGEGRDGCTSAGEFDYLYDCFGDDSENKNRKICKKWVITKGHPIECWECIHDQVDFFEKV